MTLLVSLQHITYDLLQGEPEAEVMNLAQIMKFAKEHPGEIIILKAKLDGVNSDELRKAWADTAWALLGERLLQAPSKDQPNPKYHEAVESNKNIILAMGLNLDKQHPLAKHLWDVGGNTPNWVGDGSELLWNEPTWQSGDLDKVIKSTEEFINKNQAKLAERNKFWVASLQLTPVLGQNIVTFFKDGASVRPKDLALGGGLGSHGKFDGSNAELRKKGILKKALWKNHASCIMYDFCDTNTTGDIVAMNLPGAGGDDDGPARKGGGRHDGNDDDDGPGGGRGGGHHRGGGGEGRGGGHRGGRGRGHDQ